MRTKSLLKVLNQSFFSQVLKKEKTKENTTLLTVMYWNLNKKIFTIQTWTGKKDELTECTNVDIFTNVGYQDTNEKDLINLLSSHFQIKPNDLC